jgi:hypothetical protein
MRTPQITRTTKSNPERGSSGRASSSATALVIEQVLAELGVHARLSDIVREAQLIESVIQPSPGANGSSCAE